MREVLKASDSYCCEEALNSRMNYRKIYESRIKDKLFEQLCQIVKPGQNIKFDFDIYQTAPLKGQPQNKIYLRGKMDVEISDMAQKQSN